MIEMPLCMNCKHYRKNAPGLTCDAFPAGIPDPILESDQDHRKPIDGDHGIVFDPIDPAKRIPSSLPKKV